ncbi:5'-nucleotidase/5'-nucleotidase/UDP-sugar diphosphatase [Hydrogenispora ethanolica]|uniref:5'-nucleotidase/5'-nucleotidase/UDP-sugar diphosphatase n=1 Tax=Hydrogenispora ethanolica TaxID=1082276 RepID=A0A4R1R9M0_HYDET|nr:bifunctional UDP-sugar hydrolase/5'-nucleotidase [Hydrogenispora ethanolica]TCL62411.1 5'-nucleotidase/5'-nucleotidase/UDP-sugar diphosphatase [Hydrogenispora ethanolica]
MSRFSRSQRFALILFILLALIRIQVGDTVNVTLSQGIPNLNGVFSQVYTLDGEVVSGPVDQIIPTAGTSLPSFQPQFKEPLHIRLFHLNDLHGFLTIPNSKKGDTHYYSQMVKIVKQARDNAGPNEAVLFLSAGDDHTGSVFDELLGMNAQTFTIDPAYRAHSEAGIDAAVLGNHEFDRGTPLLAKAIAADARFPIVSANVYGSKFLTSRHYHPALIGIIKGFRVGIIGLTTAQDTHTQTKDDPQLKVASPVKTLENLLPQLAELSDLVIILSHVGYEPKASNQSLFHGHSDLELAETAGRLTTKPVVIVGGHSHTALNLDKLETKQAGIPILQTGQRGQCLGELQLDLKSEAGQIQGVNYSARLYPTKKRDDTVKSSDPNCEKYEHDSDYDQHFENTVIAPLLNKLAAKLSETIGRVADLPELGNQRTLIDRYTGECALGNFMNDAIVARSKQFPGLENQGVDLAVFNASGINSGLPVADRITFNDWYAVMPFADTVQIGTMSGREIRTMVINNAKRIVRPAELTGPNPLDLVGYFSRGFLHFSKGLRYTIRLGANAQETTATAITLNGKPIEQVLDQQFRVAFNSFVGDGAFNEAWNGNPIGANISGDIRSYDLKAILKTDTGLVYRNEIVAYIKEQGRIDRTSGAVLDGRVKVIP